MGNKNSKNVNSGGNGPGDRERGAGNQPSTVSRSTLTSRDIPQAANAEPESGEGSALEDADRGGDDQDSDIEEEGAAMLIMYDRQTQTDGPDPDSPPEMNESGASHQGGAKASNDPPLDSNKKPGFHISEDVAKKLLLYGGVSGAAGLVVGLTTFVVLNVVVPGLGFAAGGVVAGSVAAQMMSTAAIANGGAIAAGSTVAVLQSIGATGVAAGVCAGAGAATAAVGVAAAGAGEATAAGVRYLKIRKDKRELRDQGTQTETDI